MKCKLLLVFVFLSSHCLVVYAPGGSGGDESDDDSLSEVVGTPKPIVPRPSTSGTYSLHSGGDSRPSSGVSRLSTASRPGRLGSSPLATAGQQIFLQPPRLVTHASLKKHSHRPGGGSPTNMWSRPGTPSSVASTDTDLSSVSGVSGRPARRLGKKTSSRISVASSVASSATTTPLSTAREEHLPSPKPRASSRLKKAGQKVMLGVGVVGELRRRRAKMSPDHAGEEVVVTMPPIDTGDAWIAAFAATPVGREAQWGLAGQELTLDNIKDVWTSLRTRLKGLGMGLKSFRRAYTRACNSGRVDDFVKTYFVESFTGIETVLEDYYNVARDAYLACIKYAALLFMGEISPAYISYETETPFSWEEVMPRDGVGLPYLMWPLCVTCSLMQDKKVRHDGLFRENIAGFDPICSTCDANFLDPLFAGCVYQIKDGGFAMVEDSLFQGSTVARLRRTLEAGESAISHLLPRGLAPRA